MRLQVVWFRRDLRLGDHPALHQAASEGAVLPLFILDPALLQHPETGVARVGVLLDSLAALERDLQRLQSRLLVRWGEPAASLLAVVRAYGADGVIAHVDSERIVGRVRDARVQRHLEEAGVPLRWVEPPGGLEALVPYPAYRRFWHGAMAAEPLPPPPRLATPPPRAEEPRSAVPTLEALGLVEDGKPRPPAGSAAALQRLQAFCRQEVASRYYWQLSYPAARASSGLSPYLKFGVVTHRQCLHAIAPLRHGDTGRQRSWRQLVSRLRWGAGMAQRFRYLPQLELEPLWRCHRHDAALTGAQEEMYRRWQEGSTGFPIVDAASRCLLATGGWRDLNFRSRAIHASFLTNLCGIDWRYGALHYMRHLLDGDCPIDHYQWAMQAGVTVGGTGGWTRIYHPGQVAVDRCDPHGMFIRRWLPELAELTNDQLGMPPAMAGYPPPMLDYDTARRARLQALEARRQSWTRGGFSPMPADLTPFGAERFAGGETDWCRSHSLLPVPVDIDSLDREELRALESWFVMGRTPGGQRRRNGSAAQQLSLFGAG
ncbi:FAD-binding domain-containing protein [Cyanobium sp. NIES-981]|uniref:FAD-binding domain-containing protein n=1 Tax=Cyanobium sp. NIES-981 TaxID=1851505 RepID=UPI0007DCE8E0|nr:FAD-binding domain-containing protein [Cyanobium sp. NIES-981]SBO42555.1 Deoxyribodipyrimidine photolyase [Cyanobium sp. NIES-981]